MSSSTVDIACKILCHVCKSKYNRECNRITKLKPISQFVLSISYNLALRIKYMEKRDVFLEESITKKNPFDLFGKWLNDAVKTEEIIEPNAMCLATVNK